VRGATLPDAVRDRVAQRWRSALFDGFLEKDATAIVREHLYREGHLNATVAASVVLDSATDVKTLTIDVVPGPSLPSRMTVTGNAALSENQLLQAVGTSGPFAAWRDPRSVERLLEDVYRAEGLLAARVSVSAPRVVDGTSVVVIAVNEGTPYSLGDIAVTGLADQQRQDARQALALSSGDRYRPALVADGVARLEARLRQMAYRQARVEVDTPVDPAAARVNVAAHVTLGPQSIVRDIVVEGDAANKPMVARSIAFTLGAPLDPAAIDETRRRLYGLDVYRSVDIDVQPLEPAQPSTAGAAPDQEPVTARIAVAQRPRYRLRYGIAVSDEEVTPGQRDQRLGFAADVENRNLFGRGATAGASLRLRSDQQVGRLSLGAKRFFALPIRSTVFVEREREQLNPDGAFPITTDISSLTLEQAYRVTPSIDLRYGYSTENNHTFVRSEQVDPFDLTVNIARFISGGVVDRRNDPFNPSRGWFTASTLELSTPGIGSDLKFLKNFAQYSHFVPVGTGLVVASAARLGLARTFDDEVLIPSERFFAGGASTVRGYREGTLGAEDVLGDPEGGSALLVLNGELRFPIHRWLKGVGFVDAGNVFPHVRDISLTGLQVGFGAGARVDTPFGLIRFDLGVPANPRSIDPRWRIHIGFGHAF
jgi:outer membrane protein assembly complex protein YaeT